MAKWGYLARAYAIGEFAYMRECEHEMHEKPDDSLPAVARDIEIVLEIAEDNDDKRTIEQCRKWLKDFNGRNAL